MAKGQQLKKEIQNKILEVFPNSFLYNDAKEIRICGYEGGEPLQVKVVLTCAKENVSMGADVALPGEDFPAPVNAPVTPAAPKIVVPSADEKQKVADFFKRLGL